MTRHRRRLAGLAVPGLALATALLTATGAAGASTPVHSKIGPRQWFAGVVNGSLQNAIVRVACPAGSATGRALKGQTLEVTSPPVIATNFGYTGSRGKAVVATLGTATSASVAVRFARYDVTKPFPTTVPLPCAGTGVVVFAPVPASSTSKTGTVTVSFVPVTTTGG